MMVAIPTPTFTISGNIDTNWTPNPPAPTLTVLSVSIIQPPLYAASFIIAATIHCTLLLALSPANAEVATST